MFRWPCYVLKVTTRSERWKWRSYGFWKSILIWLEFKLNDMYYEQDYSQNAAPKFCVRTKEMTDALSDLLKTLTLMLSWRLLKKDLFIQPCMMITSPKLFAFYSRFDSLHLILMSLRCRKDKTESSFVWNWWNCIQTCCYDKPEPDRYYLWFS